MSRLILSLFLCLSILSRGYAQKGSPKGASPSQPSSGQGGSPSGQSGTAFFETQMLAYGSVNQLSYAIAQTICRDQSVNDGANIVIFDQASFQNLQAWEAFKASAFALQSAYGTLLPNATGPFFAADSAAGGPFFAGSDVSGLISALAASTTNTASNFTIPDSAMAVSLLHQLKRASACQTKKNLIFTYYPLIGNSPDLDKAKNALNEVLTKLNTTRRNVQDDVNTNHNTKDDPVYAAFMDLNTQYDLFLQTLVTSIAQNQSAATFGPGPNPGITSILQGAQLEATLRDDKTLLLYANVIAAGGTQRDRKNIFSLLFGDFITYSGGVVVDFALTKSKTNTLLMADTLRYRTPNTRLHDAHESDYVESTDSQDNIYSLCNDERRHHWPGGADTASDCPVLKKP